MQWTKQEQDAKTVREGEMTSSIFMCVPDGDLKCQPSSTWTLIYLGRPGGPDLLGRPMPCSSRRHGREQAAKSAAAGRSELINDFL